MKKKIFIIMFFAFMFLYPTSTQAMRPYAITSRKECPKIELADAKTDGSLEKVECHDSYEAAKARMYEIADNDNLVLIEDGIIIDAKYGVVDYDASFTNAATKYVRVYENSTSNKQIGYIRTAGNLADDAVLLDYNYSTKRVKIKIAGLVGWITKYDNTAILYDVVPLSWTKTLQYYGVTNDKLIHYFPENVYNENKNPSHPLSIDKKPDMLDVGSYYSYDCHYFYKDMKTLINDYKNNTYEHAVNKDRPYYNYYQYLSFRTKSNYNSDNINAYINKRIGSNTKSKLYNTGEYFTWTQDHYGVNAVLMLSIGINESGNGNSNIAQTKNNLFGLNAVDSTPGESANYFASVEECIKTYGYVWLSYWYVEPGDSHYSGANLGNKAEGLNVKYASDPYWAENAAHYYFEIDSMYGFQDRNNYLLAALNYGEVPIRKSINGDTILARFKYNIKDTTVVVLEQLKDENGNLWYKIQNDPNLDTNLNYIGSSRSNPRIEYNWNGYVYVEAKYFTIISNPDDYDPNKVTDYNTPTQQVQPQQAKPENTTVKPVSSIINDASYKYDNGMVSGISLGTNSNAIIDSLTKQGASSVVVKDASGNNKNSGILATGDKIEITTDKVDVIEVVISGDTDGDGSMSALDYVNIKNHIMESHSLNGVYLKAADTDGDGSISAVDYVNIKNYIMNQ